MNRQELVNRVNAFGVRYGWEPLTDRMLRGWQAEDLFPKPPRPSGSGYGRGRDPANFSKQDYRHALTICRLRHTGLNRYDELRVGLWLRGKSVPFTQLRKSMASEAERFRKRYFQLPATWDPRSLGQLRPRSKAALERVVEKNAGNIVNYPPDVSLGIVAQWVFSVPDNGSTLKACAEIFRQINPQVSREGLNALPSEIAGQVAVMSSRLSGLLIEPEDDRNPFEDSWIIDADETTFINARRMYRDLHEGASFDFSCVPTFLQVLRPLQTILKSALATADCRLPIFLLMLRVSGEG